MEYLNFVTVAEHYDSIINENNDPIYDPEPLKQLMEQSDGAYFIEALKLSRKKDILEIGVGTGRLALKTAGNCRSFTGIDISSKTAQRAKENLMQFHNISIICGDFLEYEFALQFDTIYSSQVFWHIKEKEKAIGKIYAVLKNGGTFVLSIGKDQSELYEYGNRALKMYPDNKEDILKFLRHAGFDILEIKDVGLAYVIVSCRK